MGSDTTRVSVRMRYLTPLDRYVWATPSAIWEGLRLIRTYRPDAIVVNAQPWSALLVGHWLHGLTKLPWVADLRDPWSLHASKMARRPALSRTVVKQLEETFFRSASKIVINCESAYHAYVNTYAGRISSERFTMIRNAFDKELYQDGSEARGSAFTVAYFGSFKPFVGAEPILASFAQFVRDRRLPPELARLRIIGGPVFPAELSKHGIERYVDLEPARPLPSALCALRSADVLTLVVEPTTPLVIPGKLYDYLAARRPIFAISANDEVNSIIVKTRSGVVTPFNDTAAAAHQLGLLFDGAIPFAPDDEAVQQFDVKAQAERFAAVLDQVTSRPVSRAH